MYINMVMSHFAYHKYHYGFGATSVVKEIFNITAQPSLLSYTKLQNILIYKTARLESIIQA